jgi:hypothetical protein
MTSKCRRREGAALMHLVDRPVELLVPVDVKDALANVQRAKSDCTGRGSHLEVIPELAQLGEKDLRPDPSSADNHHFVGVARCCLGTPGLGSAGFLSCCYVPLDGRRRTDQRRSGPTTPPTLASRLPRDGLAHARRHLLSQPAPPHLPMPFASVHVTGHLVVLTRSGRRSPSVVDSNGRASLRQHKERADDAHVGGTYAARACTRRGARAGSVV